MVNNPATTADRGDAAVDRRIALSYATAATRVGLAALLDLDATLGSILRTTRDPMVGQMRLTWWHTALTALDDAPPPAQPVLQALAADVVPRARGADLATLVEGWEELLDPEPLDDARLDRYAEARGAALFACAGCVVGADATDPLAAAGRAWALFDLADNLGDARGAALAKGKAEAALRDISGRRWSRRGRPLGALALLAAMADASPPRRAGRALWLRLTGR